MDRRDLIRFAALLTLGRPLVAMPTTDRQGIEEVDATTSLRAMEAGSTTSEHLLQQCLARLRIVREFGADLDAQPAREF